METKELDLCEILKDCPRRTKFYSPIFGTVEFDHIDEYEGQIWVLYIDEENEDTSTYFTDDGRFFDLEEAECMLFPSKDNRDWSTFVVPKQEIKHFDPHTFKPFDKVLARTNWGTWNCVLFSHLVETSSELVIIANNQEYNRAVPYNEETEYLIGTNLDAPNYYKYWED